MAIERISEISNSPKNYSTEAVKSTSSTNSVSVAESAANNIPKEKTVASVQNGNENAGDASSQQREASSEQLKKAVSDINRKMTNTSCQFGIHEGTNRVMIKLVDNDTKEVIREYPAEETLDIIAKAWELAGILVDKKL